MLNLTEIKDRLRSPHDSAGIWLHDYMRQHEQYAQDISSLITEVEKLREVLGVAKNTLLQTPCQKCQSGDGIDHHDGAGCYKQEALNKIDEVMRDK